MNKTAKRIILGVTIPAAAAGAVTAGLLIYRNVNVKPVAVYPLSELVMSDRGDDSSVTSGSVSAEGLQKVFLSGTQTVKSVEVKEGQEVKKGDILINYDTSLTDIEVERAKIKADRLALGLEQAGKELEDLYNAQPHTTTIIEPGYTVTYTPSKTPLFLQGNGSSGDPYIYLFDTDDSITEDVLKKILGNADTGAGPVETSEASEAFGPSAAPETGDPDGGSVYVVVINREDNALNARITAKYGIRIDTKEGEIRGFGFFDPHLPEDIERYEEQPEPYEEESGSEYTRDELVRLRAQKEREIQDLQRNIALAQNEYEQKKLEADDGAVRAKTDGVVTRVRQPGDANGEAIVELSAGGAYYVTGTLGEFDLKNIHVGDKVSVVTYSMDSDAGGAFEGEIVEISDRPAAGDDSFSYFSYGEGNSNVSYYPFKVKLPAETGLRDDTYVEIYYDPDSGDERGVYVMNAFIRRDGGDSYVYVKGEKGLLEKRSVRIGRSLWGAYTQVKSGLKPDDELAFPYGKDVKPGAKTTEGRPEDLYNEKAAW